MSETNTKVLSWGVIIAIMIGVGLVVGLLLGVLGNTLGLSTTATSAGIGGSIGVVGAILISRRRAALNQQKISQNPLP